MAITPLQTDISNFLNGLCCPTAPVVPTNFNITADWAGNSITDQALFEAFIGSTVTDFSLLGNTLKANTTSLTNLNIPNYNVTKITSLPSNLTILNVKSNSNLSTVFTIPSSLVDFNCEVCNFSQVSLDNLAGQFLLGTLPKSSWGSTLQSTGDQPSASVQTDLTNGVINVAF
jgi:hypothetical protein